MSYCIYDQWRMEDERGRYSWERGEGKSRKGKVALKSEKICLDVLSETHTALAHAHTHQHTHTP